MQRRDAFGESLLRFYPAEQPVSSSDVECLREARWRAVRPARFAVGVDAGALSRRRPVLDERGKIDFAGSGDP